MMQASSKDRSNLDIPSAKARFVVRLEKEDIVDIALMLAPPKFSRFILYQSVGRLKLRQFCNIKSLEREAVDRNERLVL